MQVARWILAIVAAYAGTGMAFGIPFLAFGIQRIDPAARGTGLGFRVLVLPGVVALWPVMAVRWARSPRARS
jgi:hypothetical protein